MANGKSQGDRAVTMLDIWIALREAENPMGTFMESGASAITSANRHAEVDFGFPVGREGWPPFEDDLNAPSQPTHD